MVDQGVYVASMIYASVLAALGLLTLLGLELWGALPRLRYRRTNADPAGSGTRRERTRTRTVGFGHHHTLIPH